MPNHVHRQIREAVATALTGLSTTAARVYPNRLYAIPETSLPALRIALDEEIVNGYTIHANPVQERSLTLVVECCALGTDTVDDTCDQMSKEVETALAAGFTLGGHQIDCVYTGSNYNDMAAGYDAAVKRLTFRIDFFTPANTPDTLT